MQCSTALPVQQARGARAQRPRARRHAADASQANGAWLWERLPARSAWTAMLDAGAGRKVRQCRATARLVPAASGAAQAVRVKKLLVGRAQLGAGARQLALVGQTLASIVRPVDGATWRLPDHRALARSALRAGGAKQSALHPRAPARHALQGSTSRSTVLAMLPSA